MRRPRISVAGLLGVVLVCGIGFAALGDPTPTWAGVVYSGTMAVLLFATIAACVRPYRAPWRGFAVAGWGYALLSLAGPLGPDSGGVPYLLTTQALDALFPKVVRVARFHAAIDDPQYIPKVDPPVEVEVILADPLSWWNYQEYRDFRRIGHSLFCVLAGLLGAVLARAIEARAEPARRARAEGGG